MQVNATSESSQRSALKAVLWGGSAWTAENSDFDQHLTVDLGTIKNITGIATQGRAHVDEYVMEFRIQYGSNGKDFIGKRKYIIENSKYIRYQNKVPKCLTFWVKD